MGAVLKTPEIVPFRLTRDMVDAMRSVPMHNKPRAHSRSWGIILRRTVLCAHAHFFSCCCLFLFSCSVTGVEGTFRKGAEESMRVLRDNGEMLLTVLQLFFGDPLARVSHGSSSSGNSIAR